MPPGAPHVTPQGDGPLIQISPHRERGDFNFVSNTLANFKCVGPLWEKVCDVFLFFLTLHSISSKQKGLDS